MNVDTTVLTAPPTPDPNFPLKPGPETVAFFHNLSLVCNEDGRKFNGVASLVRAYEVGGALAAWQRCVTGLNSAINLTPTADDPFVRGWNSALLILGDLILNSGGTFGE